MDALGAEGCVPTEAKSKFMCTTTRAVITRKRGFKFMSTGVHAKHLRMWTRTGLNVEFCTMCDLCTLDGHARTLQQWIILDFISFHTLFLDCYTLNEVLLGAELVKHCLWTIA